MQLLDKCLRGNKIAPLQHAYLALISTCAKGVQYYCPSRTYQTIPYCTFLTFFEPSGKNDIDVDQDTILRLELIPWTVPYDEFGFI